MCAPGFLPSNCLQGAIIYRNWSLTGVRKVLLNLADLIQIDSSGVSSIVKTYCSLRGQDCELRLLRPSGHVLEVFKALHLLQMIPSFEDEKLAVDSFEPISSFAKH